MAIQIAEREQTTFQHFQQGVREEAAREEATFQQRIREQAAVQHVVAIQDAQASAWAAPFPVVTYNQPEPFTPPLVYNPYGELFAWEGRKPVRHIQQRLNPPRGLPIIAGEGFAGHSSEGIDRQSPPSLVIKRKVTGDIDENISLIAIPLWLSSGSETLEAKASMMWPTETSTHIPFSQEDLSAVKTLMGVEIDSMGPRPSILAKLYVCHLCPNGQSASVKWFIAHMIEIHSLMLTEDTAKAHLSPFKCPSCLQGWLSRDELMTHYEKVPRCDLISRMYEE